MKRSSRRRLLFAALTFIAGAITTFVMNPDLQHQLPQSNIQQQSSPVVATGDAATVLGELEVKGRAPKTGYTRAQFGDGWGSVMGCDTRNVILQRDLTNSVTNEKCQVVT